VPGTADDRELDALLEAVRDRTGVDFHNYARSTVRRRLAEAASRRRTGGLAGLRARALAEPAWMAEVLEALFVSVTSMFREPELFRAFRALAAPRLRDGGPLRAWSAGCATGEELWSLAIVLDEEGLGDRARLYGTDLSTAALATARSGALPLARMREYTAAYQRAGGVSEFSAYYAAAPDGAVIRDRLRRRAVFGPHDLTADPPPGSFDVVFCRNVLIYLLPAAQERVQERLARAVRPGGILALGRAEALLPAVARQFEELDGRHKLFVRTGKPAGGAAV
jgi:chemotaxis protein methyltransferase CheR